MQLKKMLTILMAILCLSVLSIPAYASESDSIWDAITDAAGGTTFADQANTFFGWFGQTTGTSKTTDAETSQPQDDSKSKDPHVDPETAHDASGTPGITESNLETAQNPDNIYYYNPERQEELEPTEATTAIDNSQTTIYDNSVHNEYHYYGDQKQENMAESQLPSNVVATTTTTYTKTFPLGIELEVDENGHLTGNSICEILLVVVFFLICGMAFQFSRSMRHP